MSRERDLFQAERNRLEEEVARGRQDVAGHAASLASIENNLARQVAALEDARADLKGHREVVQELRREQLGSRLVIEEMRAGLERVKELEGHLNEAQVELHHVNSMASQWHEQWLHATRWRRKTRGWLARLLKILRVRSRSRQDLKSD